MNKLLNNSYLAADLIKSACEVIGIKEGDKMTFSDRPGQIFIAGPVVTGDEYSAADFAYQDNLKRSLKFFANLIPNLYAIDSLRVDPQPWKNQQGQQGGTDQRSFDAGRNLADYFNAKQSQKVNLDWGKNPYQAGDMVPGTMQQIGSIPFPVSPTPVAVPTRDAEDKKPDCIAPELMSKRLRDW